MTNHTRLGAAPQRVGQRAESGQRRPLGELTFKKGPAVHGRQHSRRGTAGSRPQGRNEPQCEKEEQWDVWGQRIRPHLPEYG